jgi:hypothetical protein
MSETKVDLEMYAMQTPDHASAGIIELGDALVLTKGSYPSKPETFGTIDKIAPLELDLETLDLD